MSNFSEVLFEIQSLDLRSYPKDRIENLLRQLGEFGVIITTLAPGKTISRGRLIVSESDRFKYINCFSYNPNTESKYFRASTPNTKMFYGSYLPELLESEEPKDEKFTIIFEISEFARCPDTIGEQEIGIGFWEVTNDLNLVTVFNKEYYKAPSKLVRKISKEYKEFVLSFPKNKESSIKISDFLALEFAKTDILFDYEYLISSIYSQIVASMGYDGIIYPSVQMDGAGINIALTTKAADNKLAFYYCSKHTIVKNGLRISLSNDFIGYPNTSNSIDYFQFKNEDQFTKHQARQMVGIP
jgi:hypothetical protein